MTPGSLSSVRTCADDKSVASNDSIARDGDDVVEALVAAAQARGFDPERILGRAQTAPPLWTDASIEQQIDDITLLLRPLRPAEIRVRVQAPDIGSTEWEVTVIAADRLGLLSITTSVLVSFDLSVTRARVGTWPDGLALQHLWVRANEACSVEPQWGSIGQSLQYSLEHEIQRSVEGLAFSSDWVTEVRLLGSRVERDQQHDRYLVALRTDDCKGVLSAISTRFADLGINVISAEIETTDGTVRDLFVVDVCAPSHSMAALLLA